MKNITRAIRPIYLYTVSIISLLFIGIGTGMLINVGMKTYIFTKADVGYCREVTTDFTREQCDDDGYCEFRERRVTQEEKMDCRAKNIQESIADALTMIFVALPIFGIHWLMIRREHSGKKAVGSKK